MFPDPEREPEELRIDHPIFNCVFTLKEKPQIPAIEYGIRSQYTGITWERPDAKEVHYRAIFDDQHRIIDEAIAEAEQKALESTQEQATSGAAPDLQSATEVRTAE